MKLKPVHITFDKIVELAKITPGQARQGIARVQDLLEETDPVKIVKALSFHDPELPKQVIRALGTVGLQNGAYKVIKRALIRALGADPEPTIAEPTPEKPKRVKRAKKLQQE